MNRVERLQQLLMPIFDDGYVVLPKFETIDLLEHEIWCPDAEEKLRNSLQGMRHSTNGVEVFNLPKRIIVINTLMKK